MKLFLHTPRLYRVKRGQTLEEIAAAFRLPPALIVKKNALTSPLKEGQVLVIPSEKGNLYTVRGGESKTLLCGSPEAFEKKNGTRCLYIGQTVFLQ